VRTVVADQEMAPVAIATQLMMITATITKGIAQSTKSTAMTYERPTDPALTRVAIPETVFIMPRSSVAELQNESLMECPGPYRPNVWVPRHKLRINIPSADQLLDAPTSASVLAASTITRTLNMVMLTSHFLAMSGTGAANGR
jgi:hypothetical protein